MKGKHFIITFFNLKIWQQDKRKQPTSTVEWLSERFQLFETYCLPSVKMQTRQDFVWLCLFDEDTPQHFRDRIEVLKKSVPQLHDCYYSASQASQYLDADEKTRCRFIRDEIRKRLDTEDEYVITTNLDNDDALNIHMIERLHNEIDHQASLPMAYRFIYGMQYFTDIRMALHMRYPHNHFLSLVESTHDDFHTIAYYAHARVHRVLPYTDISGQAGWLEVVHGHNVSNDLRITSRISYRPCLGSCSLNEYGIDIPLSATNNICKLFIYMPFYFCKVAIWRLKKKIMKKKQ